MAVEKMYIWRVADGKIVERRESGMTSMATGPVRSNNRWRRRFALRRSQGRASHLDAARPHQSTSPATTPFEGDALPKQLTPSSQPSKAI